MSNAAGTLPTAGGNTQAEINARELERRRASSVLGLCLSANRPDLASSMVRDGTTVESARVVLGIGQGDGPDMGALSALGDVASSWDKAFAPYSNADAP